MAVIIKTFPRKQAWQQERPDSLKDFDKIIDSFWKPEPKIQNPNLRNQLNDIQLVRDKLSECKTILENPNLTPEKRARYEKLRLCCSRYLNEPFSRQRSLYEQLDIAIAVYEKCIEKLRLANLTASENEAVTWLRVRCENFIGIIADNLYINAKEINEIKEKRKIDPTYLPNHLPANFKEPVYFKSGVPLEKQIAPEIYAKLEEQYQKHLLKIKYQNKLKKLEMCLFRYQQCSKKLLTLKNEVNQAKQIKRLQIVKECYRQYIGEIMRNSMITEYEIAQIQEQRRLNREYLWEQLYLYLKKAHNFQEKFEVEPEDVFRFIFKKQRLKDIFTALSTQKLLRVRKEYIRKEVLTKSLLSGVFNQNNLISRSIRLLKEVYLLIHNSYITRDRLLESNEPSPEVPDLAIPWTPDVIAKFSKEDQEAIEIIRYFNNLYPQEDDYLNCGDNGNLLYKYLDHEEREPFRIIIQNGKLYRLLEKHNEIIAIPFNTAKNYSHSKQGWISIIMTPQGELFGASHIMGGKYAHSSFTQGSVVYFAGEIEVSENGSILGINDYSGHYQPRSWHLNNFVNHLARKKVDLSKCTIYQQNWELITAKQDKIKKKYKDPSPEEAEKILNKLDKLEIAIEKLDYSYRYTYQGRLIPSSPLSIKKKLAYGLMSVGLVGGIATVIASSVLSLGLVPLILGIGVSVFCTVNFLALKFNWYEKLSSFVKQKKSNFQDDNALKIKEIIKNEPLRVTHLTTLQKLKQASQSKTVQNNLPNPDNNREDDDEIFRKKWRLSGIRTDYPQWVKFTEYLRKYIHEGNYAKVNTRLTKHLKELLISFYDTENKTLKRNGMNKNPVLPEAVYPWNHEHGIITLFVEIALEYRNNLEQLAMIENKVFKPALAIIEPFVSKFSEHPLKAGATFTMYENAKNKVLVETFSSEDNCKFQSGYNLPIDKKSSIQLH